MCLGVPGKVVRWLERTAPFESAEIEFAGVRKPIHMACVPDAAVGEYVIVHAGVAICKVDEAAAARTLAEVRSQKSEVRRMKEGDSRST